MKLPAGAPIRLSIFSCPAHLPVVRGALERLCQAVGFDDQDTAAVVLSVDEALSNVIKHAYDGAPDRPIDITISPLDGRGGLRVCMRDYGTVVDRSKIRSRDLSDVRPGGLGVHIIHQCMDCVDYTPAEGGGTVLTMTKCLPSDTEVPE